VAAREATDLGKVILARMSELGWMYQAELSRAAHVSGSTISRWLYEKPEPERATAEKIAGALDVDADELLRLATAQLRGERVSTPPASAGPPPLDALGVEVGRMLADDSPLTDGEKTRIRTVIDAVIEPARPAMRRKRSA
jgi:transcriptional regulator with XRE-family HTH domain